MGPLASALLLSVCAVLISSPPQAQALGPIISGGARGIYCDHARPKVRLLDLWEAEQIYGRKLSLRGTDERALFLAALSSAKYAIATEDRQFIRETTSLRGADAFSAELSLYYDDSFGSGARSPAVKRLRGIRLNEIDDAFGVAVPRGCRLVQLARYSGAVTEGSEEILIDQDLVDQMDATNRAALWLHELLYAELRQHSEANSVRTRRIVGLAFTGYQFPDPHQFIQSAKYRCADADNEVFILTGTDGGKIWWSYLVTKASGYLVTDFPPELPTQYDNGGNNFPGTKLGFFTEQNLGWKTGLGYRIQLTFEQRRLTRFAFVTPIPSPPEDLARRPLRCVNFTSHAP